MAVSTDKTIQLKSYLKYKSRLYLQLCANQLYPAQLHRCRSLARMRLMYRLLLYRYFCC
jgi:hypothetical protein